MKILFQLMKAFNESKTITVHLRNGTVYNKCQVVSNEIFMGKKAKKSYTTLLKNSKKYEVAVQDIEKIV